MHTIAIDEDATVTYSTTQLHTVRYAIISNHCSESTTPDQSTGTLPWGILKGGPQLTDRAETADHIHKDATDRYAPCLQAFLLFARPIVNIGDFYYCVVLTIINVILNGITCIYKILEIN